MIESFDPSEHSNNHKSTQKLEERLQILFEPPKISLSHYLFFIKTTIWNIKLSIPLVISRIKQNKRSIFHFSFFFQKSFQASNLEYKKILYDKNLMKKVHEKLEIIYIWNWGVRRYRDNKRHISIPLKIDVNQLQHILVGTMGPYNYLPYTNSHVTIVIGLIHQYGSFHATSMKVPLCGKDWNVKAPHTAPPPSPLNSMDY